MKDNKGNRKYFLIAAAVLTAVVVLLTCIAACNAVSSLRNGDRIVYLTPSSSLLENYACLKDIGTDDVYICDLSSARSEKAEIPSTYRDKPVAAVICRYDCNNDVLKELTIDEGVRYVENLNGLGALESVTLPGDITVTEVTGHYIPANDSGPLLRIELTGDCTHLPELFYIKGKRIELVVNGDVESISGDYLREYGPLRSITFCGDVGSIEGNAFYGCPKLGSVVFSKNVEKISGKAFSECPDISELEFRGDVGSISGCSFSCCPVLEKVVFSGSLAELADKAFSECPDISELEFRGSVGRICDRKIDDSHKGCIFGETKISSLLICFLA